MPETSTFLRFTTRGLLLVMLGLSVGLAIAFSLLPPLLGITRTALAIGLGLYLAVFGAYMVVLFVAQYLREKQSGECLFVYPSSLLPTWIGVACFLFLASGIMFVAGCRQVAVGREEVIFMLQSMVAGLMAAAGCNFLLRGRSMASLEFREHGIVTQTDGFVPWFLVRVRHGESPDSLELWLRSKKHHFDLTESEHDAIEAILTKYKPGYAELGHD